MGLRSHLVQRGYIYITSNYDQKRMFYVQLTVRSFFCKRNYLGKGFIEGVKEITCKDIFPLQIKMNTLTEMFLSTY